VLLDGQVRSETQVVVDAAKARLAARDRYADLDPALAGFVADVVNEARIHGQLVWQTDLVAYCPLCRKVGGYHEYKSGPRRGERNLRKPRRFQAVNLAHRFVRVAGHITLGGCLECVVKALPTLRSALVDVPVQLPGPLLTDGEARWARHPCVRCTVCGWEGHQGEMGRRPTIFGDGTYPAVCPDCGAENGLGRTPVQTVRDEFTMVRSR
jgi:hypothetical protein